jgi:hypothetical protein
MPMKTSAVLLCAFLSIISSQAANIYFVSFHGSDAPSTAAAGAGLTSAPDKGYTDLLTANGHTVTRVVSTDDLNTNVFAPADLVIISRSVASGHYQQDNETAAWNGLAKPVMVLGGYVLRGSRLGFTSGETIPDTTNSTVKLKALALGHPIFNGIALDPNGFMINGYANRVMYTNLQQGISVNTSAITNGGVVLGVIGNLADPAAGGMVIGEWLPGAIMANPGPGTPPARDVLGGRRLVFLTGSREQSITSEAAGMYDLTADGAQMFLNAVNYMLGARSSIRTVNTVNNETPGAGETSLLQALSDLQDGDYIRFNIPGAGPHVIVTPLGGYPLITNNGITIDGYTQPGSVPNTNAILRGNNAQLKIVIDSTGTDSAENPSNPALPLRRSTRLPFSGYGDSENGIFPVLGADNFAIRGLSFVARFGGSDEDPSVYAVALVNGATNARVQGCWFGLPPGGSTMNDVKAPADAVAAFRFNNGDGTFNYSEGLVVGTDGDGINDRSEFNVTAGCNITFALELPNARVSGNYVNVFPNGTNFVNIDAISVANEDSSVEFLENGRAAHNMIVGTDGNGVSDSDERNIVANTVYDVHLEVYSAGTNMVIAGNYFGVGTDGVTAAPLSTNDVQSLMAAPGSATVRIGSNGDGVSDDLEGNLIVNGSGTRLTSSATLVVYRRNRFVNCNYTTMVNDAAAAATPTLNAITNNIISGTFVPAATLEYAAAFIDVYTADPAALANTNAWPAVITHPNRWLAAFTDNGPGDLDLAEGAFAFNISSFGVADSNYVTVTVTYSRETTASNAGLADTTAPATPVSRRPSLTISIDESLPTPAVILSWIAPENTYVVQENHGFDVNTWLDYDTETHTGGRNIVTIDKDAFAPLTVYRLISQ